MKNTNTKKILITVAILIVVAIILYFAFPSLTGRSVAPADGVAVTAETITDSEWGFSFPNTAPGLTLVAYGSDNPCNDIYCRELSNGLMYTVTDISAGLATPPESFRSNANKLPIYEISDTTCFMNEEKKYLLCFQPLPLQEEYEKTHNVPFADTVKFYYEALDGFKFI
ncbi:MAG TPA: hypothetical protein PK950_00815 [Candidatus Paceibacterota bacterium]|nr:hypothetical protein [Candidatus Paceibacterota bacterium]